MENSQKKRGKRPPPAKEESSGAIKEESSGPLKEESSGTKKVSLRAHFMRTASQEFRSEKEHGCNGSKSDSSGPRREPFFMAKGSSDMKWQRAKMVVGALEVKSYPFVQPKEDMKPMYTNDETTKSKFEDALQVWEDLKLRKSFTKACHDLPHTDCCCGSTNSDNLSTIKQYVHLLNEGWVKHANNKLKTRGFKIDSFIWNCQNTSEKSANNVLLIRFFELSTYKFNRAYVAGSLDLDDMLLEDRAP